MVIFGLLVLLLFLLTVTIWHYQYEKERHRKWVLMEAVAVEVDGKVYAVEISQETYNYIRTGLLLRNRGMKWFLAEVVKTHGDLTEENIIKYMDEKWIL